MRHAVAALALLLLPVTGGAQSSNTSVNCSNGVCTRTETYRPDDGRGPGWTRTERWREDRPHHAGRHGWGRYSHEPRDRDDDRPRRRQRRDRDDDDD